MFLSLIFSIKIPDIFGSRITKFSLAQITSVIITTITGTGIWLIVATIARPEDIGVLGRVISTSSFIAGLVMAGFGQFILTVIRSVTTLQIRRYFLLGLIFGGILVALLAISIAIFQEGKFDQIVIATAILSIGIAITNLQDALYLGTALPYDIPLKSTAILFIRLMLLIIISKILVNLTTLLIAFVTSQIFIGTIWVIIRGPKGFRLHKHFSSNLEQTNTAWIPLVISYLYSISITSITTGIPALVTTFAPPANGGNFYIAWTLAGLLGSISIAVANSILAVSLGSERFFRKLLQIILVLSSILSFLGLLASILLPRILTIFIKNYQEVPQLMRLLIVGQVFFGIAVVSLAAYRSITLKNQLFGIFIGWPLIIGFSVLTGVFNGGTYKAALGFIIGNIITAIPICLMTFKTLLKSEKNLAFQRNAVLKQFPIIENTKTG